ncbi:unnamed protein product [Porites lobata]|uniref:Secreted protein n=1 Tax=Porites lobata TaxID=104759 RepID=A0ABN8MV18_9CNID|nr:unnamed protein product [Porites lobata]
MKYVVFFLGFLLTLALFAQRTECFTAGIGNVGVNGKRQVKVHQALDRVCRETLAICVEAGKDYRLRSLEGTQTKRADN